MNFRGCKRLTVGLACVKVLLSFPIFITAYVAADSCFLTSNVDGSCTKKQSGVELLLGIRGGSNFQLATEAFLFVALSVITLRMLNHGSTSRNLGMVLALSFTTCYLSLVNASFFGGLSGIVNSIDCSTFNMTINKIPLRCSEHDINGAYVALCIVWAMYFVVDVGFIVALWKFSDLFSVDFDEDISAYGQIDI